MSFLRKILRREEKEPTQNFSYKQLINGEWVVVEHIYYTYSGDHFWKGKRWSEQEWNAWVNDLASYN